MNLKLHAVLKPIRTTAVLTAFAALTIGMSAAVAQPAKPAADAQSAATDAQPTDSATVSNADSAAATEAGPAPIDQQPDDASKLINWVLASRDNGELPFIVIDKVGAEMFVFDAAGQSMGKAPVLVGITEGDDSSPGVGDRELSHIPVAQRTTPAGRFVAKFGRAIGHERVLWVDYGDAISLHPVITSHPKEHRLKRLNSPTPKDNRITFGCINVPTAFFKNVVRPLFLKTGGVVYILPEIRSLSEAFPAAQFASWAGSAPQTAR